MIIQLEVYKKLVRNINVFSLIALLILVAGIFSTKYFNIESKGLLSIIRNISLICVLPIVVYIIRYLFLSYTGIETLFLGHAKYNEQYFIYTMIVPFVNIIVTPFYLLELIKYFCTSKDDKNILIYAIILNCLTNIFTALRIINKNMFSVSSSTGIFAFPFGIISLANFIMVLVSINILLKNQTELLNQKYNISNS
jgi:hypothetical protein